MRFGAAEGSGQSEGEREEGRRDADFGGFFEGQEEEDGGDVRKREEDDVEEGRGKRVRLEMLEKVELIEKWICEVQVQW